MSAVLFDDALPTLVRILKEHGGAGCVEQGTILRDATGRLTFFSRTPRVQATDANSNTALENSVSNVFSADQVPDPLALRISAGLGAYARENRPVVYPDEPGAMRVLDSPERIPVQVGDLFCHLIDRRIVGAGWLAEPVAALAIPPRLVFASLKGGVGRSTALTVLAADLARRNQNVLVVDLDLEAPGLGHLLLDDDRLPPYGVIDFLVENGVGGIEDDGLRAFVGTSHLTEPGGGRVDVMPAIGARSAASPENVMAKLSRAMIEDLDDKGVVSVGQQVSKMIERITSQAAYDVVLIDSRAGLAELAAPAVTGLGATVLLFGTAQKQTIEGYRALFSALQLLAQRDRMRGHSGEWRMALRPVYSKASLDRETGDRFQDDLYELYSEHLYDAEDDTEGDTQLESLRFVRDEINAPHRPLVIPFNQAFVAFDPARVQGQLSAHFYEQSFRPFINDIDKILATVRGDSAL
jgi:hypothetical protein